MTRFFKNAVQKEKFNEKDNLFDQDDLTDDNTEQKYIHYQIIILFLQTIR